MGDRRLLLSFLLGLFVVVLQTEPGKRTVDANREQLAVVVVKAHSLDLVRVSLDFQHLFHGFIRVTENLNRAWSAWLSQARKNQRALVTDQDLRIGQVLLVTEFFLWHGVLRFLGLGDLANATVRACRVDVRFHGAFTVALLTVGLEARDGAEIDFRGEREGPGRTDFAILRVEFPDFDGCILTAGHEASVVLQPVNPFDGPVVAEEFELLGDRCCVKLVHPDFFVILASEEVTTV